MRKQGEELQVEGSVCDKSWRSGSRASVAGALRTMGRAGAGRGRCWGEEGQGRD